MCVTGSCNQTAQDQCQLHQRVVKTWAECQHSMVKNMIVRLEVCVSVEIVTVNSSFDIAYLKFKFYSFWISYLCTPVHHPAETWRIYKISWVWRASAVVSCWFWLDIDNNQTDKDLPADTIMNIDDMLRDFDVICFAVCAGALGHVPALNFQHCFFQFTLELHKVGQQLFIYLNSCCSLVLATWMYFVPFLCDELFSFRPSFVLCPLSLRCTKS